MCVCFDGRVASLWVAALTKFSRHTEEASEKEQSLRFLQGKVDGLVEASRTHNSLVLRFKEMDVVSQNTFFSIWQIGKKVLPGGAHPAAVV